MLAHSRPLMALLLAAALSGCAATPEALEGEFSALRPGVATAADTGAPVRWGGRVLDVRPEPERTCFEILSLPLGRDARPDTDATPGRRFLACRDGFADPAAYPRDRLITVTGELVGFSNRSIGEYEYRYPRVRIRTLHLWPRPLPPRESYPAMSPWWHDAHPFDRYPYRHPRYW